MKIYYLTYMLSGLRHTTGPLTPGDLQAAALELSIYATEVRVLQDMGEIQITRTAEITWS